MNPKRPMTHRDVYTPKTPARGVPVEQPDEEITGKHDGDELAQLRSMRPTDDRVGRLETKHDELVKVVTAVQVSLGTISGQLSGLPELVSLLRESMRTASEREHVTLTATVEVDKAQKLDAIDANKDKRKLVAQIVAAIIGGGALGKLLHMAGWL